MDGIETKRGFISYSDAKTYYEAIGKLSDFSTESKGAEGLYHYTSTNVLNSILASGVFRATNLFYLNDKIEYKMGIDILKKIFSSDDLITGYLEEIEDFDATSWGGVYSISYSSEADVLQQWTTYAKEAGVCIELNGDIIWNKGTQDLTLALESENGRMIRLRNHCFLELVYQKVSGGAGGSGPQLEADKIRRFFAEAIRETQTPTDDVFDEKMINDIWENETDKAKMFLKLLAAYYKEERFEGEKEIRAAFVPVQKDKDKFTKISYFVQSNGNLRPYISVKFLHRYQDLGEYKEECPIKTILVGPGGNQQNVYDSIIHRLRHGEVKCWKYTERELSKHLSDYVLGCYRNSTIKEDSTYKEIAQLLATHWAMESGYSCEVKKATKTAVTIEVNNCKDKIERIEGSYSDEARKVVKEYEKNNYLSGHGIWVKKSSLSYIF